MASVFISHSSKDADFGRLCQRELQDLGIDARIDKSVLRAGDDWRRALDQGIETSDALIVVVSPNSAESYYVTYEWALALGLGRKVIPVLLAPTKMHPRLEVMQYIDFSNTAVRPWEALAKEVRGTASTSAGVRRQPVAAPALLDVDVARKLILEYLEERELQMVSFEKIREAIDHRYDDDFLMDVVSRNTDVFRRATLKGERPGVKTV